MINTGVSILLIRLLSQNASVGTTGSNESRYMRLIFGSEPRKIYQSHAFADRLIKLLGAKCVIITYIQTVRKVISETEERLTEPHFKKHHIISLTHFIQYSHKMLHVSDQIIHHQAKYRLKLQVKCSS
jgi:hypothetical protein